MKEKYALLAEHMTRSLQLPEDMAQGNTLIFLQGQDHVRIENFKGIFSYTEEEIQLKTKKKCLCISGKKLNISTYTKDEMVITGMIQKVEYR